MVSHFVQPFHCMCDEQAGTSFPGLSQGSQQVKPCFKCTVAVSSGRLRIVQLDQHSISK